MQRIFLQGRLICVTPAQVDIVLRHLPKHIRLSLAERGCERFEVVRSEDPMVWLVDETFASRDAFDAHQARAADSEWGRATKGIARDFAISEE